METTKMSTDRGKDKQDVVYIYMCVYTHTHKMEYHSDIKNNEIMPSVATWVQLEIIILSEESQEEKEKYHMISLMCGI